MGKNDYLEKRRARDREFFNAGMDTGIQLAHDFIQMALHEPQVMGKDTIGKSRFEKVFQKCAEYDDYYHLCFTGHIDADKRQEEMDAVLKEIYGEELVPFQQRYPHIKQYGYLKPQKGWVD